MVGTIAADYAPTGRLRAALNFGNPVLVGRDEAGEPVGITVDLATELARSLSADLELLEFARAADVTGAAEADAWDVCFLAVDPARSRTIAFTEPYLQISGCYLVRLDAAAHSCDDVAPQKLRIGVVDGSAYALHLSRQPGADLLVAYPTFDRMLAAFDQGTVDGIAGIEEVMAQKARERPGSRILYPPFMEIRQGMGVPANREHLVPDLQSRLDEFARNGLMPSIFERHGLSPQRTL
jgi:polar amino acid transport system substrate-binding protein